MRSRKFVKIEIARLDRRHDGGFGGLGPGDGLPEHNLRHLAECRHLKFLISGAVP